MPTKADLEREIDRLEDRIHELENDLDDERDRANDAEADCERAESEAGDAEYRAEKFEDQLCEMTGAATEAIAILLENTRPEFEFTREWWRVRQLEGEIAAADPLHA